MSNAESHEAGPALACSFRCGRDHGLLGGSRASELARQFYAELRALMLDTTRQPGRYHLFKADFRRANLKRFPYHFLYRVVGDCVRILVVRHHRRDPEYGLERK